MCNACLIESVKSSMLSRRQIFAGAAASGAEWPLNAARVYDSVEAAIARSWMTPSVRCAR